MIDWSFPYPSQRMPVLAGNVVATSQPLAAQAGLRMLLRGGNAIDAALAAAIALTVVEPCSNGIGSDAFALVWDGETLHGLNGSGRSPAAWTPERFAGQETMPAIGWDAVTVPGAVSAWAALWRRFGSLPFPDLFAPAIEYAEGGFLVSPVVARQWWLGGDRLGHFPSFAATFLPGGRAPAAGERVTLPDHARTLRRIAETEGEAFYRGDLAEKIADDSRRSGGAMTADDLAAHRADWIEPMAHDYRSLTLHEIPPNGQGLAALIALGILEHWPISDYAVDSAASLHLQIEAMKLAFADARRYVSDPESADLDCRRLLDDGYLAARAKEIQFSRALDPSWGTPPRGDTVLLAAADSEGRMVSFIQSNFAGFGSGIVVPGTGISLQNRATGFTLEPGHPNQVSGSKRPYHTIIPGFVTEFGQPRMAFGVMGGPMQPQGHVQMLVRIADYGQNPQAAADAPRWQVLSGRDIAVEPGFPPRILDDLTARGHHVRYLPPAEFGGAQLIWRLEGGYAAASDPRKDGQAVGF